MALEGHNFIALHVLVPVESEIVAAFLCRCRRPITMNDADLEVLFLVKL